MFMRIISGLVFFLLVLPLTCAFGNNYLITLKNGKTLNVSSFRQSGDNIKMFFPTGSATIPSSLVSSIRANGEQAEMGKYSGQLPDRAKEPEPEPKAIPVPAPDPPLIQVYDTEAANADPEKAKGDAGGKEALSAVAEWANPNPPENEIANLVDRYFFADESQRKEIEELIPQAMEKEVEKNNSANKP